MSGQEQVAIHVRVDSGNAVRELGQVAAAVRGVDAAGGRAGTRFDDFGTSLDHTGRSSNRLGRALEDLGIKTKRLDKDMWKNIKAGREWRDATRNLERAIGKTIRRVVYLTLEFGAMTLALGSVKLALWAAEGAAKLWNFTLNALGAAAGVAIGGLSGVLGALRELQAVRLQPLFGGATGRMGAASQMNLILGDPNLGMFSNDSLIGAIETARRNGTEINSSFRSLLEGLGNFAVAGTGDPGKNLGGLVEAFTSMNKEGKITKEVFEQLAKSSPEMKAVFEEFAKKKGFADADKAAEAGTISAQEFTKALSDGSLKSAKPYMDLLDKVNDTVVGRFKSQLKVLQNTLVEVSGPLLDMFKEPVTQIGKRLTFAIYQTMPVITREFGRLNEKLFGGQGDLFGNMMQRLVRRINMGIPMLIGWGEGLYDLGVRVREFFQGLEGPMQKVAAYWDKMYEGFVQPIGTGIWETLKFAVNDFGETMAGMDQEGFANAFQSFFEGLRGLISAFNDIRAVLSPLVEVTFRWLGMIFSFKPTAFLTVAALLLLAFGKISKSLIKMGSLYKSAWQPIKALTSAMSQDTQALNQNTAALERNGNARRRNQANGRINAGQGGGPRWNPWGAEVFPGYRPPGTPGAPDLTGGGAGAPPMSRWGRAKGWMGRHSAGLAGGAGMLGMLGGMYISGSAAPTNAGAQALGGALSGASTGAMIGSMFGPWGALIGGGLGGLAGGVQGFFGAKKAQKEQKERRIKERSDALLGGVDFNSPREIVGASMLLKKRRSKLRFYSLLQRADGDRDFDARVSLYNQGFLKHDPNNLKNNGDTSDVVSTEIKRLIDRRVPRSLKENADSLEEVSIKSELLDEQLGAVSDSFSKIDKPSQIAGNNLIVLSKMLGMTGEEIDNWTESTGYEIEKWGVGIQTIFSRILKYTGDLAADAATAAGRLRDMINVDYESQRSAIETNVAADRAIETARTAKPASDNEARLAALDLLMARNEFAASEYAQGKYAGPEDFRRRMIAGEQSLMDQIASADPRVRMYVQQGLLEGRSNLDSLLTPENLLQTDFRLANESKNVLGSFTSDNRDQISTLAEGGAYDAIGGRLQAEALTGTGAFANASQQLTDLIAKSDPTALGRMIAGGLNSESDIDSKIESGGRAAGDYIKTTLTTFFSKDMKWPKLVLKGKLETDGDGNQIINFSTGTGDTSSPRSRSLGGRNRTWRSTLGQHGQFDAGLAGSRQITSGIRDFALGSPSSDHAAGRAYDLVGDQLGMYANRVRDAGGFAEFHGRGGSRHLHVVPDIGPMGDTATPTIARPSLSGGSMSQNVTFNITAGDSATPEQIAQAVMVKLARAERTARERG